MSTCPQGHVVEPGHRFCPECGAGVEEVLSPLHDADEAREAPNSEALASATRVGEPDSQPGVASRSASTGTRRATNRTPLLIGAIAVLAIALLAFVLTRSSTRELRGNFGLFDQDTQNNGCIGTGGYNDIQPGAAVSVRSGTGETLATGRLNSGEPLGDFGCTYTFTVEVPDAEFYRVEVSHRGEVEFSKAELERQDWEVELTLGDLTQ